VGHHEAAQRRPRGVLRAVHHHRSTTAPPPRSDAEHAKTLDAAFAANPDRFRGPRPHPPKLPTAASINDPSENHSYGTNSE
jgi:hypothetical protein